MPSLDQLMRETTSLVDWLGYISKLIVSGRHGLCRIRGLVGCRPSGLEAQSSLDISNTHKESSVDSTTADLTVDFPFIAGPHAGGEEHLSGK